MAALYMTPGELAERWHCSPKHVRRLCASGELPSMRLGDLWRISIAAVEDFEQRQTTTDATHRVGMRQPLSHEEVSTTTVDGFTLPSDYVPVFAALWPAHAPQAKKKRPSAAIKGR